MAKSLSATNSSDVQRFMEDFMDGFNSLLTHPDHDSRQLDVDAVVARSRYYQGAEMEFAKLFNNRSGNGRISQEEVQNVLSNLYVDGVPYGKKYGLTADEYNYRLVMCHVVENLTNGAIAQSCFSGKPMQAFMVDPVSRTVDAVTPSEPIKPVEPQKHGVKRFFNKYFGLFKKDVEQYDREEEQYSRDKAEYDQKREGYEKSVSTIEEVQRNVQDKLSQQALGRFNYTPDDAVRVTYEMEKGIEPNFQNIQRAQEAFQNADTKKDLHAAAKSVFQRYPIDKEGAEKDLKKFFGDDYIFSDYNAEMSAVSHPARLRSDVIAYMMAFGNNGNGMTLDQALNADDATKRSFGKNFMDTFMYKPQKGDDGLVTGSPVKGEDDRVDALARMHLAVAKEKMLPMDPLKPEDILQHGLHNMVLGQMSMDVPQAITNASNTYKAVDARVNSLIEKDSTIIPQGFKEKCAETGQSVFARIKENTMVFKNVGTPLEEVMLTYSNEEFTKGGLTNQYFDTIARGKAQAPVQCIAYPQVTADLYGKTLYEYSKDDFLYGAQTISIGRDDIKVDTTCNFFNGKEVSMGKLKSEAYAVHAVKNPQSQQGQPQTNQNEVAQNEPSVRQIDMREELRQRSQNTRTNRSQSTRTPSAAAKAQTDEPQAPRRQSVAGVRK